VIAAALIGVTTLMSLLSLLCTCWLEWPWRRVQRLGRRGLRGLDAAGAAPCVVYLHGLHGSHRCFALVEQRLRGRLRQIAIDRPGAGLTGRAALGLEKEAALILQSLDELGVGEAVLAGCRDGAAVAVRIAQLRPALAAGLVLSAPRVFPRPAEPAERVFRGIGAPLLGPLAAHFLGPWLAGGLRARIRRARFGERPPPPEWRRMAAEGLALRPGALHQGARAERLALRGREALMAGCRSIRTPAILLTDTVEAAHDDARLLAQLLQHAELICVPGGAAMPHAFRPGALAAAIARLAGLRAAPYAPADS